MRKYMFCIFVVLVLFLLHHQVEAQNGDDGEIIVIIPLKGQIGLLLGETENAANSFDAQLVEQCLKKAVQSNATRLILVIDSHGGYLGERDRVYEVIENYRTEDLEIIVYVKEALGAMTMIALGCDQLYVHPTASIGAAAVDRPHTHRWTRAELDAFDSAEAAHIRSALTHAGRPPELADALAIRNTTLWWSQADGYSNTGDGSDAIRLTDDNMVLTLTADQMLQMEIADGSADSADELAKRLFGTVSEVKDISRFVIDRGKRRRTIYRDVEKDYLTCFDLLEEMRDHLEEIDGHFDGIKNLERRIRDTSSSSFRQSLENDLEDRKSDRDACIKDFQSCSKKLKSFTNTFSRISKNKSAPISIDELALCRLRKLEDAVITLRREPRQDNVVREYLRIIERLIESWEDCETQIIIRSSKVRQ